MERIAGALTGRPTCGRPPTSHFNPLWFGVGRAVISNRSGRVILCRKFAPRRRLFLRGFWAKGPARSRRALPCGDLVARLFFPFDRERALHVRPTLIVALAYFVLPFDTFRNMMPLLASPMTRPCWRDGIGGWWRRISARQPRPPPGRRRARWRSVRRHRDLTVTAADAHLPHRRAVASAGAPARSLPADRFRGTCAEACLARIICRSSLRLARSRRGLRSARAPSHAGISQLLSITR